MKFLCRASTYFMLRIPLLLLIGAALLSASAYSQGKASIVGTVTDPSGAVIPGAKITITNTETGLVRPRTLHRALQRPGGGAGLQSVRANRYHAERE
jgi:hypothetical protein